MIHTENVSHTHQLSVYVKVLILSIHIQAVSENSKIFPETLIAILKVLEPLGIYSP